MPTNKSTSNPQRYDGGINENIGPAQFIDGVYSVMDNIKLDINGRLKRDLGYTVNTSVTIPVMGVGNIIPFAGKAPLDSPTGTIPVNYTIRQMSTYATPYQPILNIEGDPADYNLFYGWIKAPGFTNSYQDVRCLETFKNLYILSNNGTTSNPLLKFDYKYQKSLLDTINLPYGGDTQKYSVSPSYFVLDSYNPVVEVSHLTSRELSSDPRKLPVGLAPDSTYAYKYSFVMHSGSESVLSAQAIITTGPAFTNAQQGIPGAQINDYYSYFSTCFGFKETWSQSIEPYTSAVKSVRIYRTHASTVADGYKVNNADGSDPNIYWLLEEVPYTRDIFHQDTFGTNKPIYIKDITPDIQLISAYIELGSIQASGNFGLFAGDRIHVSGDLKFPNLVYVSEASIDTFRAQNSLSIPSANVSNPVSAMAAIQGVVYVFNKNFGISKLMPNGGGDTPYTIYPVSINYGCDGPDQCINAGGLIYFVFNKHLYQFDGNDIKDIGIPIQSTLDLSDSQIKLMYDVKKEYMYINVKDANYYSIQVYCWSIRHRHFTTESLDILVVGDKKTRMDDIYYNRSSNFLMVAVSNTLTLDQAFLKETNAYTQPLNWKQLAFSTTAPRQATIVKPLEPSSRGMLNKLTLYGINPAVYLGGNFIASGMQLMLSKDGITYSNLMDASIDTRRGADLRLNISQEVFYLKFLWNTPNTAMLNAALPGQESVLDFWTYTFTPMASTSKQTTAGRPLQES